MNKLEKDISPKVSLQEIWSHKNYAKYKNAEWDWWHLPFSDCLCAKRIKFTSLKNRIENKSILELGSAMGQAYQFMKSSGLVDVSRYSGIEVSRMGVNASRERFPEANWIHADFTKYSLKDDYDYSFERHAIHHMENPLEQFKKVIQKTTCTFQTLFRGRTRGATVSDLKLGRFTEAEGEIYLNVINLFDVLRIGLNSGFNHFGVMFCGLHEPISTDPQSSIFLDSSIQKEGSLVSRFAVRMVKCGKNHAPYFSTGIRFWRDSWSISALSFKAAVNYFFKDYE